jgi:hypothetical protein
VGAGKGAQAKVHNAGPERTALQQGPVVPLRGKRGGA